MIGSKRLLLAVTTAVALAAGAGSASAAPPYPGRGDARLLGRDTANFAQDWKLFPEEGKGVAGLVRYFGGSNPTEWLRGDRLSDCAA
jgi:hypothetical protein